MHLHAIKEHSIVNIMIGLKPRHTVCPTISYSSYSFVTVNIFWIHAALFFFILHIKSWIVKSTASSVGTASASQNQALYYVRRSIMYEKSAFCSPEECSSVARQSH